jgi:hypothetical protein
MQEPAEYILKEWEAMCEKAKENLRSDCPLLKDYVLVEMHKYVCALRELTKV